MAAMESDPDEAMTREELQATESPIRATDAFSKLMASSRQHNPVPRPQSSRAAGNFFKDRMALGAYIADPASHPPSTVIYFNDDFVAIHDKFPKATIHTLLLPRSQRHALLHPFDAFEDAEFLAKVQAEVAKLKALVASELQRKLGSFSRADAARQAILNGEDANLDGPGLLPPGRDWAAEVKCGVHAVPSMGHLHIHVFSRDMRSPAMKHRKHYNSFNTPFLVDVGDLPLGELDPRRDTKGEGYLRKDFKCWRCGRNFGNRFKELKDHIEQEFDAWRKE
ncbi:Aprataxin-like protein [Cladobotryum mycophilum]|uniref:Aprataxin-like protein n=1 Tax=Cladobotryum mycophilum TaxID=491253 RepID=A0ABR0SM83_9HYPO